MNKDEAAKLVSGKLKDINSQYTNTSVHIKNCIEYFKGQFWYFEYEAKGEALYGGPAFGIFVHSEGNSYELHYVGGPWDTGHGSWYNENSIVIKNGNTLHPHKYFVRYFMKQTKIRSLSKQGNIQKMTFKEDDGYDIKSAVSWLKLDLCIPHKETFEYIQEDSGNNINDYNNPSYNKEFREEVQSEFNVLVNDGLLDENWDEYYNKQGEYHE